VQRASKDPPPKHISAFVMALQSNRVVMKSRSFVVLGPAWLLVFFPEYVISQSSADPATQSTPAPDETRDAGIKFGALLLRALRNPFQNI
jgi:hypothetical protein